MALDLTEHSAEAYKDAPDHIRRLFNRLFFKELRVVMTNEDDHRLEEILNPPFDGIYSPVWITTGATNQLEESAVSLGQEVVGCSTRLSDSNNRPPDPVRDESGTKGAKKSEMQRVLAASGEDSLLSTSVSSALVSNKSVMVGVTVFYCRTYFAHVARHTSFQVPAERGGVTHLCCETYFACGPTKMTHGKTKQ